MTVTKKNMKYEVKKKSKESISKLYKLSNKFYQNVEPTFANIVPTLNKHWSVIEKQNHTRWCLIFGFIFVSLILKEKWTIYYSNPHNIYSFWMKPDVLTEITLIKNWLDVGLRYEYDNIWLECCESCFNVFLFFFANVYFGIESKLFASLSMFL